MKLKAFTINRNRLESRFNQLAKIGQVGQTGVCRLAHSVEDLEAMCLVESWMKEAGLQTKIDAFGNVVGRLEVTESKEKIVMIGSHIDTQPSGGRFDGVIGVLGGIEIVQTMRERGERVSAPIVVVAFSDEEGTRFQKGLFGVRGLVGQLEKGELERVDDAGITRREALAAIGCPIECMASSKMDAEQIGHYLEMHIEQGPVLEALNEPIGIVQGITGPLWLTVELHGKAGHAGAVPIAMRQDALLGAVMVINHLHELLNKDQYDGVLGTVGYVKVYPNSRNVIPEKVCFTIDLRSVNEQQRNLLEQDLYVVIAEVAEQCRLTFDIQEDTRSAPQYCDPTLMQLLREESAILGNEPPELMSGPFHDALVMSTVCPFAMIFVRSKGGISHHPAEYSSMEDIVLGTELLYRTVKRLVVDKQ